MKVSFRSFKMTWNMCFLNYHCLTRSHSRHLLDSSIALFLQSLTLPNVCAFILSKLLIALMGFPRLGAAFYIEISHEHTQSMLNDVRHARYVVSHGRPPDSWGLKGWLQFLSNRVIGRIIFSQNSKQTAVGKPETIQILLQMYGLPCSGMLTLDLVFLKTIRNSERTGYQPYRMWVVLLAMPNFDQYSMLWPMLSPLCLWMSNHLKLS